MIDILSGRRLEPDAGRGVRVAYMDFHPTVVKELEERLRFTRERLDESINRLEKEPCFITQIGEVHAKMSSKEFIRSKQSF